MSLERITKLVPPPKSPLYAGGSMSWAAVQETIGARLPDDLDRFGRIYGSGKFEASNYIKIFNPYDPGYVRVIQDECEIYRGLKEDSPEWCPYECFPSRNGLFPIAGSDTGVQFYLLFSDTRKQDTVIFNDRSTGYLEFHCPMFEFFYDFLCNKIEETPYFDVEVTFISKPLRYESTPDDF